MSRTPDTTLELPAAQQKLAVARMPGPINSVMVVGYGTMGRGVLASFAEHGAHPCSPPHPTACTPAPH